MKLAIPNLPLDTMGQVDWLKYLGATIQQRDIIINTTTMEQCKVLYYVHCAWIGGLIREEVKGFWGLDFYKWAKAFSQRRGKELAQNTIDNRITVYRDYIAEEVIEAPEYIEVQKRDDYGKLIAGKFEKIKPDFKNCDFTKLLNARKIARQGTMTPIAWSMLFDPLTTVEQLKMELKNIVVGHSEDISMYEQDGIVYAKEKACEPVPICFLVDDFQNVTWQKGIQKLLEGVAITPPLEYIKLL